MRSISVRQSGLVLGFWCMFLTVQPTPSAAQEEIWKTCGLEKPVTSVPTQIGTQTFLRTLKYQTDPRGQQGSRREVFLNYSGGADYKNGSSCFLDLESRGTAKLDFIDVERNPDGSARCMVREYSNNAFKLTTKLINTKNPEQASYLIDYTVQGYSFPGRTKGVDGVRHEGDFHLTWDDKVVPGLRSHNYEFKSLSKSPGTTWKGFNESLSLGTKGSPIGMVCAGSWSNVKDGISGTITDCIGSLIQAYAALYKYREISELFNKDNILFTLLGIELGEQSLFSTFHGQQILQYLGCENTLHPSDLPPYY